MNWKVNIAATIADFVQYISQSADCAPSDPDNKEEEKRTGQERVVLIQYRTLRWEEVLKQS